MAQHGDNFILRDNSEINPSPQNLATALVVIGRTARKYMTELDAHTSTDFEVAIFSSFITRGTPISQGPTVPEHRANLENRLNTSLAYRPYRPYTSFTPRERHSSHSPHRVSKSTPQSHPLNIASLQSTTLTGSSCGPTKSLSPPPATISFTSPGPSSIPIASLDISAALVHPSSPTTAQITITDAQQNNTPMRNTPINGEPPSHANREIPMDQDVPAATPLPLISPITHLEPASDIPTSSGRHRALPLPLITENYLGQLVNQQVAQLSDKVVVPALRSIHSTCSHTTPPALTRAWKHRGSSEDDDASQPDCDDNLTPSPHRKHPGKRGIKNQLHRSFRIYLREKHLLRSKTGPLPQSPLSQMVHAFTHYNESSPSLGNITIDWQDSLRSSLWNTEVINLMVVDFQEKIQTGSYPSVIFNEDTMNLGDLRLLCIDKLRRTQQAYRQRSKIEEFRDIQEREEATRELSSHSTRRQCLDRLNTCKHGTLERCQKIAEQNHHRNPQTWDTIKRIIDRLDVDGMSGDETDTAIGAKPKIVRRVTLPWISPAITDLLHAVESYAPATYEENMSVPVGNTSLPRSMEAKRTSNNSIAIAWLPRNWYNDIWYKANSSGAWAFIDARKDFELLCLDVYHSANVHR
ncbi:uncharacterized protein EDB91DRAFT_1250010 [Suillus paluster]|uniref:uncharacterized protein n=1 Tax=Suillus paluster TaxID=48578 RepID=UPI001B8607F0|nr:uncharacterized protein EDB91DRAFT_1250010 [Suillus paluster]KAG1736397.1 hypothetical protein EDB91DRAFT_1250010 [Suillus paluster]